MKKIVIGEDSSVLQNLIKRILGDQNYDIIGAKNGNEVLKIIENQAIDLVLLDIQMPQMNGIECLKIIRSMENLKKANTPAIAVTGNLLNYTEENYKELGFQLVLLKPINFDLLLQKVQSLIEK